MHVLFLNQFFYPDLAATSQYLTDLTRALGPEIDATVICGESGYAAGQDSLPPPARIIRLKTLAFSRGASGRIASYLSFLAAATLTSLRIPKPDLVITLTTPPLLSLTGLFLQTFRGARHIIWEMDLYPDIAVDLDALSRDARSTRLLRYLADKARFRADAIVALGHCMKDRLIAHGVSPDRIHIVENWADGVCIAPHPMPPAAPLTLHYSGNLGIAHDEATLRSLIVALAGRPEFRFVISGGGQRRNELQVWCSANRISNVEFQPYALAAELSTSLAQGHIGLVTQVPQSLGSVVPSKTYGILASGRPILYIGPAAATPARIIRYHNCGWHFENGKSAGIVQLLERLSRDITPVINGGVRARQAFEAVYDRPLAISRFITILNSVMSKSNDGVLPLGHPSRSNRQ